MLKSAQRPTNEEPCMRETYKMAVLINFKICDNSPDCNGIASCPNKVFCWDEKKKSLVLDNSKCTSCGLCEKVCEVGAIHIARDKKEYAKIKKEIENDPRKISDLFIDRYGSQPIEPAFFIPAEKFNLHILKSSKLAVAELFDNKSINCLLCSIPIGDLFKDVDMIYRKIETNKNLTYKYKITILPSLLFFKDGKLLGKIEGYYPIEKKKELMQKITKILSSKTKI